MYFELYLIYTVYRCWIFHIHLNFILTSFWLNEKIRGVPLLFRHFFCVSNTMYLQFPASYFYIPFTEQDFQHCIVLEKLVKFYTVIILVIKCLKFCLQWLHTCKFCVHGIQTLNTDKHRFVLWMLFHKFEISWYATLHCDIS